jgi:hypothetical protein
MYAKRPLGCAMGRWALLARRPSNALEQSSSILRRRGRFALTCADAVDGQSRHTARDRGPRCSARRRGGRAAAQPRPIGGSASVVVGVYKSKSN